MALLRGPPFPGVPRSSREGRCRSSDMAVRRLPQARVRRWAAPRTRICPGLATMGCTPSAPRDLEAVETVGRGPNESPTTESCVSRDDPKPRRRQTPWRTTLGDTPRKPIEQGVPASAHRQVPRVSRRSRGPRRCNGNWLHSDRPAIRRLGRVRAYQSVGDRSVNIAVGCRRPATQGGQAWVRSHYVLRSLMGAQVGVQPQDESPPGPPGGAVSCSDRLVSRVGFEPTT